MKLHFPLFIILIFSSCGGAGYISPGELQDEMQKNNTVIIDLRNNKKFGDSHIRGAVNAEYHEKTFLRDIQGIDKKSAVILYCGEGVKSDRAAVIMKKNGFSNIRILEGGYSRWLNEGFPSDK